MPFCPKCKVEYREGFEYCSDCKIKLVDNLDDIDIDEETNVENKTEPEKINISDFLDEQTLEALDISKEKLEEWKENPPSQEELKEIRRFILQQRKLEEEKEKFVSKKEKASDYLSSGILLTVLGVLGDIFVVLAFCGVIPFIHLSGFSFVIYAIVGFFFASFIYFGISSLTKVKSTKDEAVKEDTLINEINTFFKGNITAKSIDEGLDLSEDDNLNYYLRTEKIKNIIKNKFPEMKEGFIDELIDENYSNIFG